MVVSLLNFLYKGSEAEVFTAKSRNLDELHVKISDIGSQYFHRYDLWKLGFLQAPEFHLKDVTLVKSS